MAQLNRKATVAAYGVFIRQLREKQELKQQDVADMVGITQSYYSNIEAGKREIGVTLANNICDVLGTSMNEFLIFASRKRPTITKPTIPAETENSTPL